MTIVDQRTSNRKKAKWWKMIIGNTAADCGMRRVYQNDLHATLPLRVPLSDAGRDDQRSMAKVGQNLSKVVKIWWRF